MSEAETYEYAEVVVGYFGRPAGSPAMPFMHVRDLTGDHPRPDWSGGPLEALNMMGAQGWRCIFEADATSGVMGWIWAAFAAKDESLNLDNSHGTRFLMVRRVRN